MNQLQSHRALFPALANKIYFNYGGQGPLPQKALEAIIQTQSHYQELGPFGNEAYYWLRNQVQGVREAIASEFNIPSSTLTLTGNVTVGCNIGMWGINWQKGDHLLLSDCEHPGVIATSQEISRRFGVEVSTCPILGTLNEGNPVEIIAQNLRPRTRLVVLSHVLWNTGQVLPLEQIVEVCKNNNSLLLVDAAQSAGVLPLNLIKSGVDFYAFTGHKWLCGPDGVGGLYVRESAREQLNPTFIGLNGVTVDSNSQPTGWQPDGKRYEVSTLAYSLYIGLGEAIATHNQWGNAEVRYQQILKNSQYLWQKLTKLNHIECLKNSPPESGLVSFKLINNSAHRDLVQFLETRKILTRTIASPSCIRVSIHYLTLETEIDQLIDAIEDFCNR
ncbi:MAG TPA: aminotransferase class V-fold PLP-dependent enzyme [Nostocaceae cyanobacterium]|nr:aminotransferase class V-fold PLP-dependent enzyme [Nostocaceae cyanobacterium]